MKLLTLSNVEIEKMDDKQNLDAKYNRYLFNWYY